MFIRCYNSIKTLFKRCFNAVTTPLKLFKSIVLSLKNYSFMDLITDWLAAFTFASLIFITFLS